MDKLELFKAKLSKEFGKASVINLKERETYKDVIPCTSYSFNLASGIGGVAKGKIYEIFADPSSGKSTLSYDIIANCQKKFNEPCLIIEKEDSYGTKYGERLGVDNENLVLITPETQQQMYEMLLESIKANIFGVIVIDSLTSFAPKERFDGSAVMGIEARVNSHFMRLVISELQKTNTTLIILQQVRQSLGGAYGDPTTVSGGKAVSFYAHVRIKITRSEIDKELQQNTMKFHFVKNKLATPFKVGSIVYSWEGGFDNASEMAEIALESNIIKIVSKSYFLPEVEEKIVGKKKVIAYLKENPDYIKNVLTPLVHEYLENKIDEVEEEDEKQI